jgi:hypothetical protein
LESCVVHGDVDELSDLLRALGSALNNLGFVAAADYCRAQAKQSAAGKQADADLAKVLDRLVEEGWRMYGVIVSQAKATEPLASAA